MKVPSSKESERTLKRNVLSVLIFEGKLIIIKLLKSRDNDVDEKVSTRCVSACEPLASTDHWLCFFFLCKYYFLFEIKKAQRTYKEG